MGRDNVPKYINKNVPRVIKGYSGKWTCDLEVSATDNTGKEVFVYSASLYSIDRDEVYIYTNMTQFIDNLINLPYISNEVSIHNLGYDAVFILGELMALGYRQRTGSYNVINGLNIKDTKELRLNAKDMNIIANKGEFYKIQIATGEVKSLGNLHLRTVTFIDSYKLIPFSLQRAVKDFLGENIPKDGIDHSVVRPRNYMPNGEELEYIVDDVYWLGQLMKAVRYDKININGMSLQLDKLTISATAFKAWKGTLPKRYVNHVRKDGKKVTDRDDAIYRHIFPKVDIEIDYFLRPGYRGGLVMKFDDNIAKYEGCPGIGYDRNSAYASILRNKLLPTGKPRKFKGCYKDMTDRDKLRYPLVVQKLSIGYFQLKEGQVPTIRVKNRYFDLNIAHESNIVDGIPREVILTLTHFELEDMLERYIVDDVEWLGGFAFKAEVGLFTEYIDTVYTAKIDKGNGMAIRGTAKLLINALYGRFGLRREKSDLVVGYENGMYAPRYWTADGECTIHTTEGEYLPLAIFVTSYARMELMEAIDANRDRILYADTDSIILAGTEAPKGIEIHDTELGQWSLREEFTNHKIVKPKLYALELADGWQVKGAGLHDSTTTEIANHIEVLEDDRIDRKELDRLMLMEEVVIKGRLLWNEKEKSYIPGYCVSLSKVVVSGGYYIDNNCITKI